MRGARGRAATGQAGRFSRCPRAFRAPTRGGDASCPGFRDGGPEAEERSRWGADPAPLPRHAPFAPFAPFRPAPAPAPPTWPLCSRSGYRLGGAEVPPGVAADGRAGLGAGVPAGWGAGVAAAACALLLLRPPRVGRWTLIPAGWQRESSRGYLLPSSCLLA